MTGRTSAETEHAWRALMAAAQSGDRVAYDRLLHEVTPFVRALTRRQCQQPADVEEIVQDTLLTLHRVRHTYDPARPFMPWLAAIASRRGIDGLRRRLRVARHETPDTACFETFADDAANNDIENVRAGDDVAELLRHLPPRQREALETLRLREMTLIEASAASGQSVGALKVNAHRALKALRAMFSDKER
jgi:RNA polymerase sigma factor (sigma-70 family)